MKLIIKKSNDITNMNVNDVDLVKEKRRKLNIYLANTNKF